MKTRLLKKLRKKASKRYCVMKSCFGYYCYDKKEDIKFGLHTSIESAKSVCLRMMTDYITNYVKKLRLKYPGKKEINFYPW